MNIELELRQQLLGNMIIGRCEQEAGIIFYKNRCSGTRCIRFTTETIESIFPTAHSQGGAWKTGQLTQYEIYNDGSDLTFQFSLSATGLNKSQKAKAENLLFASNAESRDVKDGIIAIRKWEYDIGSDVPHAQTVLGNFFEYVLPFFETEIRRWMENADHIIMPFPGIENNDALTEGEAVQTLSTRFERNPEARKRCIAHYGTKCQICGFDFGETYGPSFAGRIEVHHIVPVSEIREDYVVDPINDLIPVCSNCHTALHSKKNGVYNPEELRQFLKR